MSEDRAIADAMPEFRRGLLSFCGRGWRAFADGSSGMWMTAVLGILLIYFTIARTDAFLSVQNLRNVLTDAAVLLLLAVGMTMVIMTAGIDLSVGSVLIFSGVISARYWEMVPKGPVAVAGGLLLALVAGLAWGLLNGVLVAKLHVPSLIVTLGTLGMAFGAALLVSNGVDLTTVPSGLAQSVGTGQILPGVPYLAAIACAIAIVFAVVMARTRFGRWTAAIGSNPSAARRAGVPVDRHLIKVYALTGLLAGLAGFLSVVHLNTTTIEGHATDNLAAITAVVIGGTSLFGGVGSIGGTVVGVFIPAVLANGLIIFGVQPYWQQVLVGAILVAAVYLDIRRRRQETA